ncbi:uncharacterized protein [Aegilops tauschii subsp. strangulata]|uniref:uncharacterized protein n=1 Tax=Aegilops tauschii subsp. strangulata TaxID=200361 RepID=UPI003CC83DA7
MEGLSDEGRSIYELLRHEFSNDLDDTLRTHGESLLKSMSKMMERNNTMLDGLMSARANGIREELAIDLEQIRSDLYKTKSQEHDPKFDAATSSRNAVLGRGATATSALGFDNEHRGKAHNIYVPPLVRGARNSGFSPRNFSPWDYPSVDTAEYNLFSLHLELPKFDGTSPRLWQNRCEDQFKLWGTPTSPWLSLVTAQFEGAAARWLESIQRRMPNSSWSELCEALQNRFGRNQHQTLLRRLFRIAQTTIVEDYVERFAELCDQLTAYEEAPNSLHNITRFLDGLKPGIRMVVALQKPKDRDAAYELALLHEELGEVYNPTTFPATRRSAPSASITNSKPQKSDEKRAESVSSTNQEDKWTAMRNYRKSKGLCFVCGEKWAKDHVCKSTVQLHFVQEMIDQLQAQSVESSDSDSEQQTQSSVYSIKLSTAAMGKEPEAPILQLEIELQGHKFQFLVDSGSTHSFLDAQYKYLEGVSTIKTLTVTVAGGSTIQCQQQIEELPVIDELLDELAGAAWFTKLDLRAGYHQISGTVPTPTNVKEVRGFLGLSGYYRKFIKHYGMISKPLTELLKKGVPFVWTTVTETAFTTLKKALVEARVLALAQFDKPFVIETDACDSGIGDVLMQEGHPLAYVSKALGPKNRALSVYEKEYLAILLAVDQWRPYLQFQQFSIRTDQKSLQAKPEIVKYPGLLSPLPVPSKAWETVTMDFISGLPHSYQFDYIFVVIDKFTEYGHFMALKHPFSAQKVAEVFLDNIYKLHGMPEYIVSYRDPVFSSNFWQALVHRTGTQLNMSTAYHPATVGQTERVNQQIECYLRSFISSHPSKWSKWLSQCEFWYNTNWHSAVGKSPFEVLYGYSPRYFGIAASDTVAPMDILQWLKDREVVVASVKQHLLRA